MEKHILAIERIYMMHELIVEECTGSPEKFAKHLQISRRSLYNTIEYFNDLGASIQYSRTRRTFFYHNKSDKNIASILKLNYSGTIYNRE